MNLTADRLVGSIVAGAIGDALGGPYEGRPGPVVLDSPAALMLSDDTQLTLATCEAIESGGEVTPEAVAERFLHWYRHGRISGIGASTLKALRDLDVGAHWALSGRTGERAAGNGAAMRIAPLAFVLDPAERADRSLLRDICWITHHSDEAYAGALAVVTAIRAMGRGVWTPSASLVTLAAEYLPDTNVRDALRTLAELPPTTTIAEVSATYGNSGYVAESVPLAIFSAQCVEDIGLEGLLASAISGGGDTDTIASMAGQIAGAHLGLEHLPPSLVDLLPESKTVLDTAWSLSERLGLGSANGESQEPFQGA